VYEKGEPGGVIFMVKAWKPGGYPEEIFHHHLDAKARREDRGFFDFELELSEFCPGKFLLEIETRSADPEKNQFNTAGFTNPVIVAR